MPPLLASVALSPIGCHGLPTARDARTIPRVPPDAAKPHTLPLTPSDEARVLAGIDRFIELVRDVAKIQPADGDDTPELADKLVAWWRERPEKDPARPSQDELAWVVGCATGDLLYHVLEVRWRKLPGRVGDPERFCLFGEHGQEWIMLTPIDDVAERIRSGESDPASGYLDDLYEDEHVRGFIAEGEE
ncbi:MAG: hypothetical protein AMXMBFR58_19000 [Phycisphaerae bacterium]